MVEPVVSLAGEEGAMVLYVERHAVVAFAPLDRIAPDYLVGRWIDGSKFIAVLQVHVAHRGSLFIISEGQVLGRQCAIKHPISTSDPYPARSLFLPTILHADAVLIVAGIPRMIFQARLLILTA
jgi:hypothetical protein